MPILLFTPSTSQMEEKRCLHHFTLNKENIVLRLERIVKSERGGFEPPLTLLPKRISSASPSTTRTPLQNFYLFLDNN